jgi:hypothetical protein
MTTATVEGGKIWKRFTAVDLVTLAVFAALYRALWYVWHALGFLWPFNQIFSDLFYVLCGVAAVVIVRKLGAFTLFAVASQLINLFLQGEMFIVAVIMAAFALGGDLWIYLRLRAGADPFSSLGDMFISGTIVGIIWSVVNWAWVFPVLFLTDLTPGLYWSAGITCAIGGAVGAWIGYGLGNQIKGLVG